MARLSNWLLRIEETAQRVKCQLQRHENLNPIQKSRHGKTVPVTTALDREKTVRSRHVLAINLSKLMS